VISDFNFRFLEQEQKGLWIFFDQFEVDLFENLY